MTTTETPILVVGAGPTGLTLACELARHGAPVRIVDKLPGRLPWCRANGIHARSLEIFQDLGVVDAFLAEGQRVRGMCQYAHGKRFLHARYAAVDSPYPFTISIGQNRTEEILEALSKRLGVRVERETELVGMSEKLDGVEAVLRRADGREERVSTPWLVGCDGSHSTVRHLNRQHFPGEMDPHAFIIADVVLDAPIAHDEWHAYLTDRGVFLRFPLTEGRSLLAYTLPDDPSDRTDPPTLAEVQEMVDERGPAGGRVRDPRWLTCFHIHYRHTRHYRHGRTLLAGDAGHVHSFVGGLGMNTGIQDAYNLGWKLALVVRGRGPLSLLDSYERERWAVAEDVVSLTRALTDPLEGFGDLDPAERERLFRQTAVPEAERMDMARHGEELDLDYRRSPICCEHHGRHGFDGGPHAGAQAVDVADLRVDGRSTTLFELLRGPKHTLLLFPGAEREAASKLAELAASVDAAFGDVIDSYVVDGEESSGARAVQDPKQALHRRYGATSECLYLIRPDGYVGHRSRPAALPSLRDYLDRIFLPKPPA
jgi:2-polyprenyl-6-methoxyphenol hydroxylase-like FAD-dependent oxidoreductase